MHITIKSTAFVRCISYQDFLDRRLLLTRKLQNQAFFMIKLKSSFPTSLTISKMSVLAMLDMFHLTNPDLSWLMTYRRKWNIKNMACVIIVERTTYQYIWYNGDRYIVI
jgi:hypothetical protein